MVPDIESLLLYLLGKILRSMIGIRTFFYSCLCPRVLPLSLAQIRAQKVFAELRYSLLIMLFWNQWGGIMKLAQMGVLWLRSAPSEGHLSEGYTRGINLCLFCGKGMSPAQWHTACSLQNWPYIKPSISNGLKEPVPLNFTEREEKAL